MWSQTLTANPGLMSATRTLVGSTVSPLGTATVRTNVPPNAPPVESAAIDGRPEIPMYHGAKASTDVWVTSRLASLKL